MRMRMPGYTRAFHYAHIADGAAVVIILGVEHQRLEGRGFIALGRGHFIDDSFQYILNADALFGAGQRRVLARPGR